ncbi:hypothetical protein E2C01_024745 [Portunus trituberculatus]|uniref:Uncharacterized protein n=1 Tax=Portunus trituberculatus TaxID=210409 RepID=A0A5B7EE14_PORTR|nr:hypothetical protein [Portunus trituberculatus]
MECGKGSDRVWQGVIQGDRRTPQAPPSRSLRQTTGRIRLVSRWALCITTWPYLLCFIKGPVVGGAGVHNTHPSLGGETLHSVRDIGGAVLIGNYQVSGLEGGWLSVGALNVEPGKLEASTNHPRELKGQMGQLAKDNEK